MILNIAIVLKDSYYKLVAVGLGILMIFQVFLSIGGVTKFNPFYGCDAAICELWRKFPSGKFSDLVGDPGNVSETKR